MTKRRMVVGWVAVVDVTAGRRSRAASVANKARNRKLGPEGRRAAAAAATAARWVDCPPEVRFASASRAARKRWENWTPEQREEFRRRLGAAAIRWQQAVPPEVRSASARRASIARWTKVRAARAQAEEAPS